jgi:glycosyltransferase involved in cell wall biosynthesis
MRADARPHCDRRPAPVGRLAMVTTVPTTVKAFYKQQLEALIDAGFQVTIVSSPDDPSNSFLPSGAQFVPVVMTRRLTPLTDLKALWRLCRLFMREQFEMVQYSTPKASLLAAIASWVAKTPHRLYLVGGLYFFGQEGFRRRVFRLFEWMICSLSTRVMPVAREISAVLEQAGITRASKCTALHHGSACGVDLSLFNMERFSGRRASVRKEHNLPQDAIIIGAFGRLVTDKGMKELVGAFVSIAERRDNVYLFVVGAFEDNDPPPSEIVKTLQTHPRIRLLGWQPREALPELYVTLDVFCLPSYREGFGVTLLEASAMGVAVVATDIPGCREAVADGETGLLVEARNTDALLEGLERLINDERLRDRLARNGRRRIEARFDARDVVRAVVQDRLSLLGRSGASRARGRRLRQSG